MSLSHVAEIAVFAPFIGFLLSGLMAIKGERTLFKDRFAQIATCSFMGISACASCLIFFQVGGEPYSFQALLFPWFEAGSFHVDWGVKVDTLSACLMTVVTLVSFLVHVYSIGYMSHDQSIPRFMAYLSLFTFMMLALVTAPNLLQLFFGWEGVGLASYLLIGFWYERPSANGAAMKAFIVNRIGDVGLVLGICAIYMIFETVDYDTLFKALTPYCDGSMQRPLFSFLSISLDGFNLIGILVFIGAMGKSAQIGLHTWLPDAMEGPTPVSALIHAATMVTAGIFLVARLSPLYELAPLARELICIVGASTAFFAATIALTQTDIKRIIAYSTCSQLGYMFFAAGVSAYGAAIFHLVTHAFFKALLFLGAGAVIHAMSDEQDIRRMGGIRRMIPVTYTMMWVGSLALAGIPFFAGYYSKDAILEAAYLQGTRVGYFAYAMGLMVVILTAFYSWRLLLLTFHGEPRADDRVMAHVHKAPISMKLPLLALSIGAIFAGYWGHDLFLSQDFWGTSLQQPLPADGKAIPYELRLLPMVLAGGGIAIAYLFYYFQFNFPDRFMGRFGSLYRFSLNKWYVDDLYDWLFVRRAFSMGRRFWKRGDERIIDRFGPDGVTAASLGIARLMGRLQTGYVYHYAFAMLIGIVVLTSWLFLAKEGLFR
jgi:NADH-quinone oxidoreductase subunit L